MSFLDIPHIFKVIIICFYVISLLISLVNVSLFYIRKHKIYLFIISIITSIFNSIISYLLILTLNDISSDSKVNEVVNLLNDLPFYIYIILGIISCSLSIYLLVENILFNKRFLSLNSLKQSFDNLPLGICLYFKNGLPCLCNIKINEYSKLLTNQIVNNGNNLFETLSKCKISFLDNNDENSFIIKINENLYFSVNKNHLFVENQTLITLTVIDITTEYKLMLYLKDKNNQLRKFNEYLKEYNNNIVNHIRKKEILNTKMKIHKELGQLLIMSKKEMGNNIDFEKKIKIKNEINNYLDRFLLNDFTNKGDGLKELKKIASDLQVDLIIKGKIKLNETNNRILCLAINECLTNTIVHAHGDKIFVHIKEDEANHIEISITNNGIAPTIEIKEGGGLSFLRSIVEENGASMIINSFPNFELKIRI
ncbi:MAG: hypothetical protein PUF99_02790 [Bacilli bacterium]|nr:hypothetical protein [Bacilli bacterium]